MIKIINGDIWESGADIICIPCCGLVQNGELIMGAGVAIEAKKRFPILPSLAAKYLSYHIGDQKEYLYGFIQVFVEEKHSIGLFQSKINPFNLSTLSLIRHSILIMNNWVEKEYLSLTTWALCYPGIGLGGLSRESVEPLLQDLNPKVTVYYK